jgi:hypothetical protein
LKKIGKIENIVDTLSGVKFTLYIPHDSAVRLYKNIAKGANLWNIILMVK